MPQRPQLDVAKKFRLKRRAVERPRQDDVDDVAGPIAQQIAPRRPLDRRDDLVIDADQALGAEKADGQLEVAAGGPHRDRHADGLLAGAARPDLQRFLDDDPIGSRARPFRALGHESRPRGLGGDAVETIRRGASGFVLGSWVIDASRKPSSASFPKNQSRGNRIFRLLIGGLGSKIKS